MSTRRAARLGLCLAVAWVAGCDRGGPLAGCGGGGCPTEVSTTTTFELQLNYKLDVLFVVDDTPAMAANQAMLADELRRAAQQLASVAAGGLPALHVAFVGASLPGDGDAACAPSPLRGAACGVASSYDFASTIDCVPNFGGTFADTFSCLGAFGAGACGTSQPLEAARRALDPATSPAGLANFLRSDASLQLVFITAGDDASVRDGALVPVSDYVAFVDGLKTIRDQLSVVLVGPSASDVSSSDPPSPGTPRLASFLASFGRNGAFASVSTTDGLVTALAAENPFAYFIDPVCLTNVRDTDAATPGVQADCAVEDFLPQDQTTSVSSAIPSCDLGAPPCWRFQPNDACSGAGVAFEIVHAAAWCPQTGIDAQVTCLGCADPHDPACAGH